MTRRLGLVLICLALLAPPAWAAEKFTQYLPPTPDKLTLCSEKVPLQLDFVAEQLDREFNIAVHDQAQVVMWLKRAQRYFPYISQKLREQNLPQDLKYLAVAESALLHRVRSSAGAVGVWQFIPATARRYGLRVNRWYDDRRDFQKATLAALDYLRSLYNEFGSWALAMAAYNCGERRVRQEIDQQGVKDYYNLYLPAETMRYLFRIMAAKIILSTPAGYGYHLPPARLYEPLQADTVDMKLSRSLHLRTLAAACGTTVRRLKELNPALRTFWIPAGQQSFRVPPGQGKDLAGRLTAATRTAPPPREARPPSPGGGKVITVKPGDTLSSIARRHKVKIKELRRANRISGSMIKPGQKLVIP